MNNPIVQKVGTCSYGSLHPDHGITDIRLRIDPRYQIEVEMRLIEFIDQLNQELENE